jgi:hypothetical protein
MKKEREEFEKMKQEWAKERRESNGSYNPFSNSGEHEECRCPRCRFGDRFSSNGGGSFFFSFGGIPFRFKFGDDDSDGDSFFEDFDDRWDEQLEEEKREENRKQAEVLGVSVDSDERSIKLAYRKMALQYHPDKWKNDSEHGMSKQDAENRFKAMQSAYDHLMSNFDEDDEE